VNLLKGQADSDCSYVPDGEPAKRASVPGLLSGDPADFRVLLLAVGQAGPAAGLTGSACSGRSGWVRTPLRKTWGLEEQCACGSVHTRVRRCPAAALVPRAGSRVPFIAKFPFSCYPEGASGSCVSGRSSLESPPAFFHVSSPDQGGESRLLNGPFTPG